MPEEAKDVKSESSTDTKEDKATTEETETDETTEESESEEGDEKLPFHKHPRWKKLHGDLKQYKDMGLSPLELQAALTRLQQFETILAEEEAASKTKTDDDDEETEEQKSLRKRRKAARKELSNIAPEIDTLNEIAKNQTLFVKSLERRANRELTKVATENNLPTDKKNLAALEEVLATIIVQDEDLYYDYISNPGEAVRAAFEQFSKGFKSAAERSVKANIQEKKLKLLGLPKTHKGGAPEATGKQDKGPKTLAEARKRAEARLAALDE